MPNVVVSGYIEAPEDMISKFETALVEHTRLTRAEPGCLRFEVTPVTDIKGRYNVVEIYESQADVEYHRHRAAQSDWGPLTKGFLRRYFVAQSRE